MAQPSFGQPDAGIAALLKAIRRGYNSLALFGAKGGYVLPSAHRIARVFCVVPLLALASSAVDNPTALNKKVDQLFTPYDTPKTPGCALGVVRNGEFVYKRAYGAASLELGVQLSTRSVFVMGSISKQFTAASVVLAVSPAS